MGHDPRARREHWRRVYRERAPDAVSWYQPQLRASLELIDELRPPAGSVAVDVGAGASSLPRDLGLRGLRAVAVDLAVEALRQAPAGPAATGPAATGPAPRPAARLVGDATALPLGAGVAELWHDRAVFHFLVRETERRRYLTELRRVLAPAGAVVMATFGPAGPERCSGLPVRRYDAEGLTEELGPEFTLVRSLLELHRTPSGGDQQFLFAAFRRGPRVDPGGETLA